MIGIHGTSRTTASSYTSSVLDRAEEAAERRVEVQEPHEEAAGAAGPQGMSTPFILRHTFQTLCISRWRQEAPEVPGLLLLLPEVPEDSHTYR